MSFRRYSSALVTALIMLVGFPKPAYACLPWIADYFAPMPGCNINDKGRAKMQTMYSAMTLGGKIPAFVERVKEARQEYDRWHAASEAALKFRDDVTQFIGNMSQPIDPLPSLVAEYNRRTGKLFYAFDAAKQAYYLITPDTLLQQAKLRLYNDTTFVKIMGADETAKMLAKGGDGAETVMLKAAAAQLGMTNEVNSKSDFMKAYAKQLDSAVTSQTQVGSSLAEMHQFAAEYNGLRQTSLSFRTQSNALRLRALENYVRFGKQLVKAQAPIHNFYLAGGF